MQFYLVMFAHWVGDFVFQTEWMATQKSKLSRALLAHVATYTVILAGLAFCLAPWQAAFQFTLVNAGLHLVTDAVTSRITSHFSDEKNMRLFFVTIGFDQFLHFVALYATWQHFLLTA